MRAWRVEKITEVGEMHLRDIPLPVPGEDQYLVRVEGAGLAFGDTLIVRGKYQVKPALPFTPGSEVVGTIVQGLTGALTLGTRIVSASRQGGYAQYELVPCEGAIPIELDIESSASLALLSNFPTSLYALREVGRLQSNETLLVHAGAGGVGSAAVQLGRLMGARVIATAGGPGKVQPCLDAGAHEAVDYFGADWVDVLKKIAPAGFDVVFDPVGGSIGAQSLRCLAYGARYLIIGFAGGELTPLPANRLLLNNASAIGVLWGEVRKRDPNLATRLAQEVFILHRDKKIKLYPGRAYTFEDAREALGALASRSSVGKLWLKI